MDACTKSVNAAMKATDSGGFRGYAARFLNIDRQGDIILPGAFAKALPAFLDDGGMVLADHENKTSAVIGTLVDAVEDRNGLLVDVQFSATKAGQDARQKLIEKSVRKMSISFYGKSERYSESQIKKLWETYGHKPTEAQKRMAAKGANVITDAAEILEVSIVPIPANTEAAILSVKHFDTDSIVEESTPAAVKPPVDLSALVKRAELADRLLSR